MKKRFILAIGICSSGLLNAQTRPLATPMVKQTQTAKANTNSSYKKPVTAAPLINRALPVTVNENLVFYKWKAARWFESAMWKGEISAPDFTFHGNGTVSCSSSIMNLGGNQLLNGTYTVSGNKITIIIKQDTTAILTGNLVYDDSTKKLNGSYNFQVLNGYAAGNSAQSWMKMEINP
ncbi:hypothetical protein I5M32_10900 [Pedobacter sp. SD-b]|uniref:Uncharacterized protein n=1 Tax=Pedobacter segetis TaxID=2793069 RepID=A0ABS1BKR3_9SPHI|nr:hypothetical protein [Pedobacter segetis]MBK0383467.1 hypothetical protein [Pedobacter segetis]